MSFIIVFLSLPFHSSIKIILFKAILLSSVTLLVRAYILMKRRSEDFIGMFDAILRFEENNYQKRRYFGLSFKTFIFCSVISYLSTLCIASFSKDLNEMLAIGHLKLLVYHHIALTGFYFTFWFFVIQYINYELCLRYYSVLNFSIDFIAKFLSFRPDFVIRYQIDEVIEKFEENDQQFNQTVNPLKRIIFPFILSINLMTYLSISIGNDFITDPFITYTLYTNLLIQDFYFVFTQISIHFKSNIQNVLINIIRVWKTCDDIHKPLLICKLK